MPRHRVRFWNVEFLLEVVGAAVLVAGLAGYFLADRWAPILLAATLRP